MNLNELSKQIYQNNKEKGFWDKNRNVGEMLMLVVCELGEAMEAHRKGIFADKSIVGKDITTGTFKNHIKDTFEDEVTDTIIRLFDICGGLDIELQWHLENKLKYNQSRPRLHGKIY